MAESIYFKKESNGNVTIRQVLNDKIIYSLQPNQNVIKDIASSKNIIIKSATNDINERGIVICITDINPFVCVPEFRGVSNYGRSSTQQPYVNIDNYIESLTMDFFF